MSKKKNEKEEVVQQHVLDEIEKQKLRIKVIADTKNDLETNPKYKEYFTKYNPDSVKSFIERYANRKADFIIHGEMYKKLELDKAKKFIDAAKEYFVMIQQDKLLGFQYKWNEGNIKLEGIECNYDFFPLYEDVFSLKFISPVTKEDVDIMHDYIISHDDQGFVGGYNAFKLISEKVNVAEEKEGEPDYEDEHLPHYYFFRLKRTGEKGVSKDSLIRLKKEKYYTDLHYREQERIRGPYVPHVPADPRPHLHLYDQEATRKFVAKFEDEKIVHYYDATMRARDDSSDDYDNVNMAVWHLEDTEERHPVEANADWKQSILKAAEKSKKEKTAKALYILFDEYLKSVKGNIPFMPITAAAKKDNEIWKNFKEKILNGRELTGEPRDFNF